MAAKNAHYGWPLKMSDSNKDLYGEREILKNYIELKRNFIPSYTLCEVLRSLLISSRFLARQITPAPYNTHIDLAIQTLYIS